MADESYNQTHKRIRELNGIADSEPLDYSVSAAITCPWYFVADSSNGDTLGVCANRILLLGPQGKVPAENLRSAISYLPEDGEALVVVNTLDDLPEVGSIDKVYRIDHEPGRAPFYMRWAVTESGGTTVSEYVHIATNVVYRNGEGTVMSDADVRTGLPETTRKVDIRVGSPGSVNNTIIDIADGYLVHSKSGVGDSPVSSPGVQNVNTFGDGVKILELDVNATGHVTDLGYETVTVPVYGAGTNYGGLVQAGENSDVEPVGSALYAGDAVSVGHILLAAADHVHTASELSFTNLPIQNHSTVTYRMSANTGLNMTDLNIYPASNMLNTMTDSLLLTKVSPSTSLWNTDRASFESDSYMGWTGSYVVNTYYATLGTPTVLSHISNIDKPGIYLATAEVGIYIYTGAVDSAAVNVPYEYDCIFVMTGDAIRRTFRASGPHGVPTVVQSCVADERRVNITALLDLTQYTAADLSALIHVHGVDDSYIFKCQCDSFKIVRLK